ncbi:MAG: heparinase II/III family protein [Alphaproteobacteria bacterium]
MSAHASFPTLAMVSVNRSLRRTWAQSALSCSDWLSLTGPVPDTIAYHPPDHRVGRLDMAVALRNGVYALPGGQVNVEGGAAPWRVRPPNRRWAEALNGFGWLHHFEAVNAPEAAQHVRWLITTWLSESGQWDALAWSPGVLARRLISWFSHGGMILEGADLIWRVAFLRSVARQTRHLERTADWGEEGPHRLTAAVALTMSGLCLPNCMKRLGRGVRLLNQEIDNQILADGGHMSRNPEVLLDITLDLVALRDAFVEQDLEPPPKLQPTLDRMMPMLRFFRHGDGGLALFNGSTEGPFGALEAALARDDVKGAPLRSATHSGYERIAYGRTLVIMDAGRAPEPAYASEAHAGPLSFEMSSGQHRVIVNCGATTLRDYDWQLPLRSTAAHSTVTLADTSTSQFVTGRWAARVLGPRMVGGPAHLRTQRQDDEEQGTWLETAHDAYVPRFGIAHERRLYLNPQGNDLRGQDTLTPVPGAARRGGGPCPFELRFHLHPDVRASQTRDGGAVLLALPNGEGWNFRAAGGEIAVEESIYLGCGEYPRPTTQVVVSGETGPEPTVLKWALRRAPKKRKKE